MSLEELTNEELIREVEELKAHSCMDRVEVSKTAADIIKFVTETQEADPFLNSKITFGNEGTSSNDKTCCNLI